MGAYGGHFLSYNHRGAVRDDGGGVGGSRGVRWLVTVRKQSQMTAGVPSLSPFHLTEALDHRDGAEVE